MEILKERNYSVNTEVWNRVHIVYSLSKDLGLPGFRVGALYSNDDMVVAASTNMSSFALFLLKLNIFSLLCSPIRSLRKTTFRRTKRGLNNAKRSSSQALKKSVLAALRAMLACFVGLT
ncbi:hypothetical protein QYF36_017786 [Acer negundo]|nr:hypothetical protein QYF36_017786 [Acer negundo]